MLRQENRKREFKGVQHKIVPELGGNPELIAALQFLKTVSKVSLVHFFCFTAIMCSTFASTKRFEKVLNICQYFCRASYEHLITQVLFTDIFPYNL